MLELSAFIRNKKTGKNPKLELIPIFFKISPGEVSGIIKDNPQWKKMEENDVRKSEWLDALNEVRSYNGFPLAEDGNEVKCRSKVVEEICRFLRGINPPKLIDFEPVGIEGGVQDVKVLLDMEGAQSALAVIVYGFGGVGKTTLAASVVQSLDWSSTDFKFCKVAIDEKTPDKTSHIINLQKHILYVLRGVEVGLGDTFSGRQKIKEALANKCCLLFMDNVVDKVYIQELLPQDLFPAQRTKLRIIITSRENNLNAELERCKIIWKEYEVKGLSYAASKRLLVETIVPSQVYLFEQEDHMIHKVAAECRGVPLLLSVFGKYLSVERNKGSYQEALEVLTEGYLDYYRDEDLGAKVMFVYKKVKDDEVKEAFLDICTYFHGWEWSLVVDIVDYPKLEDLRRRTLVSKSSSGEVIVHDILRSMGMKEARLTRFSNYKNFLDALEDNSLCFKDVKGISLVNDDCMIKSTELEAMRHSLRVLMLGDWVTLDKLPLQKPFTKLRYLHVGDTSTFPFEDFSKLNTLRVFLNRSKPGMNLHHLPSKLKRLSHEVPVVECDKFVTLPFQNLSSLERFIVQTQKSVGLPKKFHLPASVELPEELHLPASLVHLDLSSCKNVPKDIRRLRLSALESVILDSSDLDRLPQGFGKLKNLKYLSMDYCSKLTFLSHELGMLSSLKALSMNGCRNLRALPESLGGLLSLQTLEFSECIKLQELPESFGKLRIQSLTLHSLVNLNELPNSFGDMHLLKDLTFISCHSLISLPNTFVQLEKLETLKIIECTKLSLLPEDFGRLRCLKSMTVEDCHVLLELPHGFGVLPALKTLTLRRCNSFVNLSRHFGELRSLENLVLWDLPMSRFPDGFGKLQNFRSLDVMYCVELKTLSNDFENMPTLEGLRIGQSPELDGAMMDKILKLPNCYRAEISGCRELAEKWEHMQGESEHPIMIIRGWEEGAHINESRRATRVALFHGKCMELNNATGQLMERSSLLVGLEEGTTATVALIMLPIHMQSHQQRILERFVEMARKRAETKGWGNLQIVCARKVESDAQRSAPTEEEKRTEEGSIHEILLLLPTGSCAIPSFEFRRVKILTECVNWAIVAKSLTVSEIEGRRILKNLKLAEEDKNSGNEPEEDESSGVDDHYYECGYDKLTFLMAKVGSDIDGRKIFNNLKLTEEDEISGNVPPPEMYRPWIFPPEAEYENYNSIQEFIQSICAAPNYHRRVDEQYRGESKTREFMEALKANGIHYLLTDNAKIKVAVDDLHGKAIGFIICNFKLLECINLQQIYKDLQQKDSNLIWIWIPLWSKDFGYGSYARLIQCMPWATFPNPQLVNVKWIGRRLVLLDKDGQVANRDALSLLMGWGVKAYPFTQHSIPQVECESCLEFLLNGMNIVGREQMKSKMTFLYAQRPSECQKMETKLKELTQIHGSLEVLYVGKFVEWELSLAGNLKQEYEDATQNMPGPSLSFSDMIMFWYRCMYLASEEVYKLNEESNIMMETLHGLAQQLHWKTSLVLVDNGGVMTRAGEDVLQMICESSDDGKEMVNEVKNSLSRGECTPFMKTFVRTFLRYGIDNNLSRRLVTCHVCGGIDDIAPSCYLELCLNCRNAIGNRI